MHTDAFLFRPTFTVRLKCILDNIRLIGFKIKIYNIYYDILIIVSKGLLVTCLATYKNIWVLLQGKKSRLIDENYMGDLICYAENNVAIDFRFFYVMV